jgi:para-nitrobenzyl esterase
MPRIQVNLPDGIVEGTGQDGVRRFLSLPYAAPMTDDRRFRAPAPVARWAGVRDATTAGPRAPQSPTPPLDIDVEALMGKPGPEGGDYLTLDVYAPDQTGA